jgi:hypothetical protein
MGFFTSLARFERLSCFNLVARYIRLGFLVTMARCAVLGFSTPLTRWDVLRYSMMLARYAALGFFDLPSNSATNRLVRRPSSRQSSIGRLLIKLRYFSFKSRSVLGRGLVPRLDVFML